MSDYGISKRKSCLITAFFIFILVSSVIVQRQLDHIRPPIERLEEKLIYIPSPQFIRSASLGFQAVLADLIWARTVVYFGEHSRTDKDYTWLYRMIDAVTTLDPKNILAYRFGGNLLALEKHDVEASIAILKKGIQNNPDNDWMLYFLLGFDYFFFLNDHASAAKYMEIASNMPGHPDYLPRLTARMYARAEKIDTAIEFLKGMYNQYEDQNTRKYISERINILVAKRQARSFKFAVDKYKETYGKYPEKLEELVRIGLIKDLPVFPGGKYVIDSNTGAVDWISETTPQWP